MLVMFVCLSVHRGDGSERVKSMAWGDQVNGRVGGGVRSKVDSSTGGTGPEGVWSV